MNLLERRRELMNRQAEESDPYLLQPFTITFNEPATLVFGYVTNSSVDYPSAISININNTGWVNGVKHNGANWWDFNSVDYLNFVAGDTVAVKATGAWAPSTSYHATIWSMGSSQCELSGNINSLVHGDNFVDATTMPNYGLFAIFYDANSAEYTLARNITDAHNLRLPATSLGRNCYNSLFEGCSRLTSPPEILPAMTLSMYCYSRMFYGCSLLTTAPILPAETLTSGCYHSMFYNCSRLNYIKAMFTSTPGGNMLVGPTYNWVSGVASSGTFVKSLSAPWSLVGVGGIPSGWTVEAEGEVTQETPFTIVVNYTGSNGTLGIYSNNGTQLPSNVSINKNNSGWAQMTWSDDDLGWTIDGSVEISVQPGDILLFKGNGAWASSGSTDYVYFYFDNSSTKLTLCGNINSLVNGDNFATSTSVPDHAVSNLFGGLSNSSPYIIDISKLYLPATTLGIACYSDLFSGASRLVEANIELPATTLSQNCYSGMFNQCASLKVPPLIKATTLANGCCNEMFTLCTQLETAPVLKALILVSNCYRRMFYGCTKLNYIKALFTTTPSDTYTNSWVTNVNSIGTFVKNSSATWNVTGTNGVPSGWTVQTTSE